jgi:hypothetical protein
MRFSKFFPIAFFFLFIFFLQTNLYSQQIIDTTRLYGVTVDDISGLNAINTSLHNFCRKPTTRIVFDEWQPATEYTTAVNNIHNVSFIMGEILDSYYMKQYSYQQYVSRVNEYLSAFPTKVDIWEIGNEVNGEWCGKIDTVVKKISAAYDILKAQNKKTEMTLYYNFNCWSNQKNEMFRWVLNYLPSRMRTGLDYVLISYYENDCNGYKPNWQRVFDSLHVLFPNSKIGMGECGTDISSQKASYMTRYYTMNITTPGYVGGYFWWYYREDCVPYTKALWSTLNTAIGKTPHAAPVKNNIVLYNYPNPFNPSTQINYDILLASEISLKIYDITGREVRTLVQEFQQPGHHSVLFDGSDLASGVYIYKLTAGNKVQVQKMVLLK